jgi:hypothetical protein
VIARSEEARATGGGLGRMLEVLRLDLSHVPRRPLYWMVTALLLFFAWELAGGDAQIGSGDVRVGGTKAFITSEFAVAQLFILIVCIMYSFFAAVGAGMVLIRDADQNVGAVLHSTRLKPGEYVWGKYFAVLGGFLLVLALHVFFTMVFNHAVPHGENQDSIGPFSLMNYLRPVLVFAVPTIVLMTGTSFAIGGLTRKPILVFALPVALILFSAFFLWDWSPSWLSLEWNRVLQFADLSGYRWIKETWLDVDRGAAFYNTSPIGLDGLVIAQRLACVAIGLGAVALVQARFTALLRGPRPKKARAQAALEAAAAAASEAAGGAATEPAPVRALGMRAKAPAFFDGVWQTARVEMRELWSQPGLYLFVPMILMQTFSEIVSTGAFDAQLLSTPGILALRQMGALTLLICMLILFYTTESLAREKNTGFAPIYYASPLKTTSILLGKALANVGLGLLIIFAAMLGDAIVLAIQGKVPFRLEPFAILWGLLLAPTFLLWTTFVCACFAVTGSRYGTYALGLGAMALTGFYQLRGKMSWTFNWDLWGTTRWSDISVLELDRSALVLNRIVALGAAAFFTVLAVRWFTRRERDATRTVHRFKPGNVAREGLKLAPWALVPVVAGIVLNLQVHNGRGGTGTEKKERDYWKKNSATWRDAKLPSLAAVDLDLEVEPAKSWLRSKGEYTLVNLTQDTIPAVPLTGGLHWKNVIWTMNGLGTKPEDRAGLYVFRPAKPLAPGDRMRIGFSFDGRYPDGVSKNGGGTMEFVLPSGVVLTGFSSVAMAPLIGYVPDIGVDEDENKADPRVYPDDWHTRVLQAESPMFDSWCDTRMTLTSPQAFQHNATGVRERESVKDGKRVTEWKSDAPLRAFNVVMGRWEVKRGDGVAVYYDARHPYNVDEMLEALAAARKWYGEWFTPYRWKELRLTEFPGLATYAQGPPTNITFSENIGFLTKSEPKANAAFWITAHEAAHQWWPLITMPGNGPGGDVLSEGMAHFSTILLTEKVKGLEQRMAFCRTIEDDYANSRRADAERPLNKIDSTQPGDRAVMYDRGGFAFWMLHRMMGEANGIAGLKDYIATYSDNSDHPLIEDYLAVMRRHAPNPVAFDVFTKQWFYGTVVPQYLISEPKVVPEGDAYRLTAKVKNVGTGSAAVTVAGARGKRFADAKDGRGGTAEPYADARTSVVIDEGQTKEVSILCPFEPERIVVDPDVEVLMLLRQKAEVKLESTKREVPRQTAAAL